jgi:hypothetical protein
MPTAVEKQSQGPVLTISGNLREIPILAFDFQHVSPRDAQSGQHPGKRQWKPVVITKQCDATSPKLLAAAVCGELLQQVKIEFVGDWLTFKNAKFIDFTRHGGNVESYTFQYEDAETGHGAAGRPILSETEPTFSMFLKHKMWECCSLAAPADCGLLGVRMGRPPGERERRGRWI